jgi:hypothetical protein
MTIVSKKKAEMFRNFPEVSGEQPCPGRSLLKKWGTHRILLPKLQWENPFTIPFKSGGNCDMD